MWTYERRLEYPVKICKPDPNAAQAIISQLGGPNGELGASLRYLNQRYSMTDRKVAGCLTDIGTEEAKEPLFGGQTREKGAPCLSRDLVYHSSRQFTRTMWHKIRGGRHFSREAGGRQRARGGKPPRAPFGKAG